MPPEKKAYQDAAPVLPDLVFEKALWQQGLHLVAGVDEAGRGALAGPVCAGVVVLQAGGNALETLSGVNDSKQLNAGQREYWATAIKAQAVSWSVGFATALEIDRLGILPATRLAVRRALLELELLPDHLLVDFIRLPQVPIPQTSLVRGDTRSLSIAAASILAKTARDHAMLELAKRHPGYGWHRNKGYGTRTHMDALQDLGPCEFHRRSFAPLRDRPAEETA